MIDVSIIIVNYNAGEFLEKTVHALYETISSIITFEVIIVDNASSDDSVSNVEEKRKKHGKNRKLLIIKNDTNLGFSKANNKGIKEAKGRYVLFLNPDAVVGEKTVETLVKFMDEHPHAGVSTSKVVLSDGTLDDGSHRGFPTPWNAFCYFSGLSKIFPRSLFFNGYNLGWRDLEKIHTVDAVVGAFMMVRREAGEDIGWWDEDYFFYGEDLDFCFTMKEKGWKIYYVPTVSTLHYKGVSSGVKKESSGHTTADEKTKLLATNARFNAMKIFYKKHYMDKYPKFITWIVMSGINIKLSLERKKIRK